MRGDMGAVTLGEEARMRQLTWRCAAVVVAVMADRLGSSWRRRRRRAIRRARSSRCR